MTPTELLKLRGRLLRSNSLFDFEIWVMILIACRLFLREDEVSSLKIEDLVPEITSVKSNEYVEGISFQVQGKYILQVYHGTRVATKACTEAKVQYHN